MPAQARWRDTRPQYYQQLCVGTRLVESGDEVVATHLTGDG
jgi:hypothetical protein